MSDSTVSEPGSGGASREEILSALFAQLVLQQTQLAMMLLGKTPHPQTGRTTRDMEGARMFIDQLEMIEAKTKGNLTREEEQLLKQSLMSLRLAFVEAVESPAPLAPESSQPPAGPTASPGPAEGRPASTPETVSAEEAESKKKFSKKY